MRPIRPNGANLAVKTAPSKKLSLATSPMRRYLDEALIENLQIAGQAIFMQKPRAGWIYHNGVFGFAGANLLFSLADAMGAYIFGGNVKDHFRILNHRSYYDLNLPSNELLAIYKLYRCLLTHNAAMGPKCVLEVGEAADQRVYEQKGGAIYLRLGPLYERSKVALKQFRSTPISDHRIQHVMKRALGHKRIDMIQVANRRTKIR